MDDRVMWVNIDKKEWIDPVVGSMYAHPMHLAHDGCHDSHLALYAMLMLDNAAVPTDILRPFDPDTMRGAHMNDRDAKLSRIADRTLTREIDPPVPSDFPIEKVHGRWAGDRIVWVRNNDEFVAEVSERIRAGETHWQILNRQGKAPKPLSFGLLNDTAYFTPISGIALQFLGDLDCTLVSPNETAFSNALFRTLGVQLGPEIFRTMIRPDGRYDLRFLNIHHVMVLASHIVRDHLGVDELRTWLRKQILSEALESALDLLEFRQSTPEPLVLQKNDTTVPPAACVEEMPLLAALTVRECLEMAVMAYECLATPLQNHALPCSEWNDVLQQMRTSLMQALSPVVERADERARQRGRQVIDPARRLEIARGTSDAVEPTQEFADE